MTFAAAIAIALVGCTMGNDAGPGFGSNGSAPAATSAGSGDDTSVEDSTPVCENDGDVLDLRPTFPDAPEGGIEIRAPYIEVPPFSQAFWCYWGTYTGPTVGVTHFAPMQSDDYQHHNLLRAVMGEGEADGSMDICPESDSMFDYAPLIDAAGVEPAPGIKNWLDLPDGVAMKLRNNQKWVLDMHYINPTGCTLLVQNAVNIGTVAAESVEQWASSLRMDGGIIELPPQQDTSLEFDCEWPSNQNVLSIGSHMHEYGSHYGVDHIRENGSSERIYEVDPWQEEYRDFPVLVNFSDGGLAVQQGERFRTSCNWSNPTDETVGFPNEMCTTIVVSYPLEEPLTCMLGEWL